VCFYYNFLSHWNFLNLNWWFVFLFYKALGFICYFFNDSLWSVANFCFCFGQRGVFFLFVPAVSLFFPSFKGGVVLWLLFWCVVFRRG